MRNLILWTVLILALLVGVVSVVYYSFQGYESNLTLKDEIPASSIYIGYSFPEQINQIIQAVSNNTDPTPKKIEYVSMTIGEINYENKGSISRVFELPRLLACVDISGIPSQINGVNPHQYLYAYASYPSYSLQPITTESNSPQNIFDLFNGYSDQNVEVKPYQKATYYANINNLYMGILGDGPGALKGTTIKIYELPSKAPNPLDIDGGNYAYGNCQSVATSDPLKTVSVV